MSLLVANVIIFVAAFVQGAIGFGFGWLAVPLLLGVYPAQVAIPLTVISALGTNGGLAYHFRRYHDFIHTWPLFLGGLVAVPIGLQALIFFDTHIIKALVAIVIIISAVLLLFGFKRSFSREKLAFFPIGFMSGFLGACIGIGGPPIVLFLSNQGRDKDKFKANLVIYFFVVGLFIVLNYAFRGLITMNLIANLIGLIPAIIIGSYAGHRVSHRFSETFFRRLVLVVVIGASVGLLV